MTTPTSSSTASTTATIGTTGLTSNSIDGLVSGLNTTDIINKLMAINALPQTNLKTKLAADQAIEAAYAKIQTDVDTLQTAAQAITTPGTWAATSASSSDGSVDVTSTGNATVGSLSFTVSQLAAGQADVTGEVTGQNGTVANGPITITSTATGAAVTITPSDNSLSSVARAVNAQATKTGVRATVIQTGANTYRLQLSSTTTGAASAYTVSGLATTNISSAQDAKLTVGSGSGSFTVTSATNTVTGLLKGTSLTLNAVTAPGAGPVTISVSDNVDDHTAKVKAMVDAANTLLTEISTDTAYNAGNKTSSVLTGNSTVRALANSVLEAVSQGVGGVSLSTLGISETKDGQLTFDASAFTAAYTADPAGVSSKLMGAGSFVPASGVSGSAVTVLTGTTASAPLTVQVISAATQSTGSFSSSSPPLAAGQSFSISVGGKTISVTAQMGWTAADLSSALATAAESAGVPVLAEVATDGSVAVTSTAYGSGTQLSLAATDSSGTTIQSPTITPGTDIQGTVNGVTMTGSGQLLIAPYGSPGVAGLSLQITGSQTGNLGTVSWLPGFAQAMTNLSAGAVDPLTGTLTTDLAGYASEDTDLSTRISDWDSTLATQRASLQMQYANLETALGKLKSEGSWLSSQIASLSGSSSTG